MLLLQTFFFSLVFQNNFYQLLKFHKKPWVKEYIEFPVMLFLLSSREKVTNIFQKMYPTKEKGASARLEIAHESSKILNNARNMYISRKKFISSNGRGYLCVQKFKCKNSFAHTTVYNIPEESKQENVRNWSN